MALIESFTASCCYTKCKQLTQYPSFLHKILVADEQNSKLQHASTIHFRTKGYSSNLLYLGQQAFRRAKDVTCYLPENEMLAINFKCTSVKIHSITIRFILAFMLSHNDGAKNSIIKGVLPSDLQGAAEFAGNQSCKKTNKYRDNIRVFTDGTKHIEEM